MKEPVDSFGRRFKDMPGDNWSVDQGLPLTITINGTVVPPSLGAFPDEANENTSTPGDTTAGLLVPTDPRAFNSGNVLRNTGVKTPAWTRFVPKRDYTIKSARWILTTVPPAAPYIVEIAIYEWDDDLKTCPRVGLVQRTSKARTDLNAYEFAADVPLTAGKVYYIGLWTDKTFLSVVSAGIPNTFMNQMFAPQPGATAFLVELPHAVFIEGFTALGGLSGINNLVGYISGLTAQITPNGFIFALSEDPGNLPV